MDGVREEQKGWIEQYETYKRNLQSKNWTNVTFVESLEYRHEAGMLRAVFESNLIKTPLILYVMHDFPLCDTFIDWRGIVDTLLDGDVSCIFFNHDSDLRMHNRPHQAQQFKDLTGEEMKVVTNRWGLPLLKTITFHPFNIATTEFNQFLVSHFKTARIHIDCDEIHNILEKNYARYKMGIYTPDGDMKRFYNLMGRTDGPKLPMEF